MLNIAYIGLGANLGDCLRTVCEAWEALGRLPGITTVALSSPYRSEPVGMMTANWFINGVGMVRTTLSPAELLARLLALELQFGRKRDREATGYQDRTLDLDLLLYNDLIVDEPQLVLPHPELSRRLFVLMPLVEIAPELRHPTLGRSMRGLLEERLVVGEGPVCKKTAWPQGLA